MKKFLASAGSPGFRLLSSERIVNIAPTRSAEGKKLWRCRPGWPAHFNRFSGSFKTPTSSGDLSRARRGAESSSAIPFLVHSLHNPRRAVRKQAFHQFCVNTRAWLRWRPHTRRLDPARVCTGARLPAIRRWPCSRGASQAGVRQPDRRGHNSLPVVHRYYELRRSVRLRIHHYVPTFQSERRTKSVTRCQAVDLVVAAAAMGQILGNA